jgi:hypothetical protein
MSMSSLERLTNAALNGSLERAAPKEGHRRAVRSERHECGRGHPDAGRQWLNAQDWEERVAREAEHQAHIEAAFDRADALDRIGDFERALEWLDEADARSGGLSPTYRAKRTRLARELARPDACDESAATRG